MLCKKCKKEILDQSKYCSHCGSKQACTKRKPRTRGNGMGSVFLLSNGKYRAVVTLGYLDGKRLQKTKSGFKTKKEALNYLESLKNGNIQNITFNKLYEMWSNSHYEKISKSKQSSYKTAYKKCSDLYFKSISTIKLNDMQKIVDSIEGGFYPKFDIKVLLNKMWTLAVQNDYCNKNYAEFIKLPQKKSVEKEIFNKEERKKFFDAWQNGNEFAGYICVMIYTGMRIGEIMTILKENVFLNKQFMIGGIKTEAGIDRVIPINDKILPIVTQMYNKGKTKLLHIGDKTFYDKWGKTLKELNIKPLTPHCCRHTFATLLAEKGIQPAIIKETTGHKSYSTTLKYTHIDLETKLKAVNSIE